MKHLNSALLSHCVLAVMLTIIFTTLVSCYHIVFIQQAHQVVRGTAFTGKLVVKATGTSTNGSVSTVTGLFGIRVPEGWEVDSKIVMKQVPKSTTDLGDGQPATTITRELALNDLYTDLLNTDYPKDGYVWMGYSTTESFNSLFNAEDSSKDVDSIYVTYTIYPSEDVTGVYYLDYVAGHVSAGHEDEIGSYDRDWNTRTATFESSNISNVYYCDTHVIVTNVDGSYDASNDEYSKPAEWELEPMPNHTSLFSVRAYKDKLYDKLFTRTLGWNGGDGVLTVGLPNGDVFWTFNDSFYGVVDSVTRARKSCSFPRNSVMVQLAHDGVPGTNPEDFVWLADYVNWNNPAGERYFHARTHLRHPGGEKTAEEIEAGEIDQGKVYWSGDGTVYNGKLQMIWVGTESSQLRTIDTGLATYSLDGTMPKDYYLPGLPDYLPHAGDYLYRESVTHKINENEVSYGSTLWEDEDGHTYLYATNNMKTVVARTQTHDLYSEWEYYVKLEDGTWEWQKDYPTTALMDSSNIMASNDYAIMLPWVFKHKDYYYLISQAPIFSPYVYIYRSEHPYGPFDDRKLLLRLPDKLDKLGPTAYHWLYMVNIHPALSREGELVLSTNSDPDDFWDNFNAEGSADYYRPYFYRIFDWDLLYPDTSTDIVRIEQRPTSNDDDSYYTLQGIRTNAPTRGIYIRNGRKVVIR